MGSVVERKDINDRSWYQILGSVPINNKKVNYYTIEKTQYGDIKLGIINKNYIGDQNSWSREHCIFYHVIDGNVKGDGRW